MTVYIAGPISNDPDYVAKFKAREKGLQELGYETVSPVTIAQKLKMVLDHEPSYHEYMKACLKELLLCDGISFLDDWKKSKGARMEWRVAKICNLTFVEYSSVVQGVYDGD